MATNQDFDNLITRIGDATDTLEVAVVKVDTAADTAAGYATQAQGSADSAANSAASATLSANSAASSALTATNKVVEAQQIVDQLEQAVVIEEAPVDGEQYARKNGAWSVVVGGGGAGTVVSVNSLTPDVNGNVQLSAVDVGAKPDSYVPSYNDLTDKPTLSAVATSGSYNDLSDKPAIPAAQVNSDWNASTGVAQILNKPTLATVATSGSYNDLTDKPSGGGVTTPQTMAPWQLGSTALSQAYPNTSVFDPIDINTLNVFVAGRNKYFKTASDLKSLQTECLQLANVPLISKGSLTLGGVARNCLINVIPDSAGTSVTLSAYVAEESSVYIFNFTSGKWEKVAIAASVSSTIDRGAWTAAGSTPMNDYLAQYPTAVLSVFTPKINQVGISKKLYADYASITQANMWLLRYIPFYTGGNITISGKAIFGTFMVLPIDGATNGNVTIHVTDAENGKRWVYSYATSSWTAAV